MLYSSLIYLTLMGLMIATGRPYYKHPLKEGKYNNPLFYCFVPSLLFAIIFGIRYGVGVDHFQYVSNYLYGNIRDVEIGFQFIENAFKKMGLHYSWFFGFIAFIQVALFTAAFRERNLYPWIIIVLFLCCRWLGWCNGIRQSLACCIFVYSIQFIEDKKPIYYAACVFLAWLFHKSALLLIPLYFIGRIDFFKVKWVPWLVFIISLLLQQSLIRMGFISNYFDTISDLFGYNDIYNADNSFESMQNIEDQSSGFGRLLINVTSCFILFLVQKEKKDNNSIWYIIISNLFLIGLFGNTAFASIVVLNRPFGYFSPFREVVIAYLLYTLFKTKKNKTNEIWAWALLFLIVLFFIAVMLRSATNTAEYHTIWE